jgi:hypothetical protein
MRRSVGSLRGRPVAAAVVAVVLAAAGCSPDTDPGSAAPSGSDRKTAAAPLAWEFTHIADSGGALSDVAALAEDDIWAVAPRSDGGPAAHLLHYDGKRWQREPLPEGLGAGLYPPRFEEIGTDELWLRSSGAADGPNSWMRWDGARWSAVTDPPPGSFPDLRSDAALVGELDALGPDDVWALGPDRTALHWDGSRWTSTRLPYDAVDLAVAGPDDVWAVGSRTTGPGTELGQGERCPQPASMHWDGESWKAVETPQARFPEPLPPEPSAGLSQVFVLDDGEVRAYGSNTFNHGEVDPEPQDEYLRLRRDGSAWTEQEPAPGQCAWRTPVDQDDEGLFLDGNWYLTDDGRCVKIERDRLPPSTGARKGSRQSLWLSEIHRVPGTDEWVGAGHVQVNQSGDPFRAPVVVRLRRDG